MPFLLKDAVMKLPPGTCKDDNRGRAFRLKDDGDLPGRIEPALLSVISQS